MGCLGFLSEFIFEAVLEACISISVFSFFDGNKKGRLAYRIFTFREFKSIHKGKTAILYLCFGTEKNRRIGQQKKPDIFGLFAGDIFFVSTLWLLRTVMMHPVFGISYFIRLGAFRDMLHFVRRDIFACAKVILRPWRSGILFAHTTAVGNSTRRSRISLRSNRTRVRRE